MLTLQNLVSTVQCTNVRFKDHRLVDTDDDTDADRMGPQFREATDLASSGSNLAAEAASAEDEIEDATNQTFSVANSTCDSTFVVGDSVVVADEPEVNVKAIETVCHLLVHGYILAVVGYRVYHLVTNLGWVYLSLGCCIILFGQKVLTNQLGELLLCQHPTKVRHQRRHPVVLLWRGCVL